MGPRAPRRFLGLFPHDLDRLGADRARAGAGVRIRVSAWPLYGRPVLRRPALAHPRAGPGRARAVSPGRHRSAARHDVAGICVRPDPAERPAFPRAVRDTAPAGCAAVQPAACGGHGAAARVQHGRQLRHQHQLAGLLAGKPDQLRRADVRPDRAQLPQCRHRHCRRRGRGARIRRKLADHARQFLRRSHARHAVPAAARLHRGRHSAAGRRRAGDAVRLRKCHHAGRRIANHRVRASGVPGGDQGVRHQRRRLLQRQLRPPVREPVGADQRARELADAGDTVRAGDHARPHGGREEAGPLAVLRNGHTAHACHRRHLCRGIRGQPAADTCMA